jgi:hypothetical protein
VHLAGQETEVHLVERLDTRERDRGAADFDDREGSVTTLRLPQ